MQEIHAEESHVDKVWEGSPFLTQETFVEDSSMEKEDDIEVMVVEESCGKKGRK